jgi:hypothetical protein
MKTTRRKVIRLAGLGASAILGANMSGFAIETAAQEAPVSPSEPPRPDFERWSRPRYSPQRGNTSSTLRVR